MGVDLSNQMIDKARDRCDEFGDRASFRVGSIFDREMESLGPFDGAVSRFVLHHMEDPARFVARQAELLRPGGVLVLMDHTADPDVARRAWHQDIEVARDTTHTANLPPGRVVDLFVAAGLEDVSMTQIRFELDFDEWFDRGTPGVSKDECRRRLLSGRAISFDPEVRPEGGITMHAWHTIVRGVRPATFRIRPR